MIQHDILRASSNLPTVGFQNLPRRDSVLKHPDGFDGGVGVLVPVVARALGVSTARVAQLVSAGLLDSWKEGARRTVSKASVEARIEDSPKRPRGSRRRLRGSSSCASSAWSKPGRSGAGGLDSARVGDWDPMLVQTEIRRHNRIAFLYLLARIEIRRSRKDCVEASMQCASTLSSVFSGNDIDIIQAQCAAAQLPLRRPAALVSLKTRPCLSRNFESRCLHTSGPRARRRGPGSGRGPPVRIRHSPLSGLIHGICMQQGLSMLLCPAHVV